MPRREPSAGEGGGPWGAVLLTALVLASCAPADPVPASGASSPARQDALDCPADLLQSAQVALAEGDGFSTPRAAVADAQATGWLPDGVLDVPAGSSRGLVRVGPEVVAEFTLEEVGGGLYYVTAVDTCYDG